MYSRLLLSTGGGVVNNIQKSLQVNNAANIIIGLGGTGKYCVSMIKSNAVERIQRSTLDTVPGRFKRIKFYAIDTDPTHNIQDKRSDIKSLDSNGEIKNIKTPNLFAALPNDEWTSWFRGSGIEVGNEPGAGGIRPAGRMYIMNSAAEIIADLRMLYNEVSQGLSAADIVFHVIAGISGGTGSGTFLDVCYLIKDAFPGTSILGYFFMPEVNADVIGDDNYKLIVKQNGYGALQDLDYCMSFSTRAGGKNYDKTNSQRYNGIPTPVSWDSMPVSICNLIGNDGAVGLGSANERYQYAIHVVAEYVMDFLVQTSNNAHTISAEQANTIARCQSEENERGTAGGTSPYYSVMGSAEAVIPFREINTYIVASLFGKYSQLLPSNAIPDSNEGPKVMREALGTKKKDNNFIEEFYNAIKRRVLGGVVTDYTLYGNSFKEIDWFNFVTDEETLRQYQTDIIIPNELWAHLQPQYEGKCGAYKANMTSLISDTESKSLICSVIDVLERNARDIAMGPFYAENIIKSTEKNSLVAIVSGLKEQNKKTRSNIVSNLELRQQELRKHVEKHRKKDGTMGKSKSETAYTMLCDWYKLHLEYMLCDYIGQTLDTFAAQLENVALIHFTKLSNLYREISSSFAENLSVINSEQGYRSVDSAYAKYLVTLEQIKATLDDELNRNVTDIPQAFSDFIAYLLFRAKENDTVKPRESALIYEQDENVIAESVISWFVDAQNGLVRGITAYTINDYLKMAIARESKKSDWNTVTNNDIENYVKPIIQQLIAQARPLMKTDRGLGSVTANLTGWISIPAISQALVNAATAVIPNGMMLNASTVTDRIYIETRYDGLPLAAISSIGNLEHIATNTKERHCYIGKPEVAGRFNDWRHLAPLTPHQYFCSDDTSYNPNNPAFNHVREYANSFDRALNCGLIRLDPPESGQPELSMFCFDTNKINAFKDKCDVLIGKIKTTGEVEAYTDFVSQGDLHKALADLAAEKESLMIPDNTYPNGKLAYAFRQKAIAENTEWTRDRVAQYDRDFYRDMFVKAPQIVMDVDAQLAILPSYQEAVDLLKTSEQQYEQKVEEGKRISMILPEFASVLLAGLLLIEGNSVSLTKEANGRKESITLSDPLKPDVFPYRALPAYQAYLTWTNLTEEIRKPLVERANTVLVSMYGKSVDETVAEFISRFERWYMIADTLPDKKKVNSFLESLFRQIETIKAINGVS